MKHPFSTLTLSLAILATVAASCRKSYTKFNPPPTTPVPTRTIRYILYTLQDFRNNNDSIAFSLRMTSKHGVLFDSALAPMRISEIPDKPHEIAIDRVVPAGFEKDTLTVGFDYKIKNVGESWFLDTCNPTTALKHVD